MIDPSEIDFKSLPWVPLDATAGFPSQPGIYFAIDSDDNIQYIGRSNNVRGRWKTHHRYEDLAAIGNVRIVYMFVEDEAFLPTIEQALISWFDPPLNIIHKPKPVKTSISEISSTLVGVVGAALLGSPAREPEDFKKRWGITQEEMAELMGTTRNTVSHWQPGTRPAPPPAQQAFRLWDGAFAILLHFDRQFAHGVKIYRAAKKRGKGTAFRELD